MFASLCIEEMLRDPYLDFVCLREFQKSLKYSVKKLIEEKIREYGVQSQFKIMEREIRRLGRTGATSRIIFEGLNDHTADSIKSLESFARAWFTEAQRASERSLQLLRPTIRAPGSELWFDWNPDQPSDPIEKLFSSKRDDLVFVRVNYFQNPFLPDILRKEAEQWRHDDPTSFAHVWLGEYNTNAEDQILHGKWEVREFEIQKDWSVYYGVDWGFSTDPTAAVECYVSSENYLYINQELYKTKVETEQLPTFLSQIENLPRHVVRADNARPENISHCKRHGIMRMCAAEKWKGSVEDGISKLRSFKKIIISPSCKNWETEARLYKYKKDRHTDDILPDVIDKHNHLIDATRYALEPLTKRRSSIMNAPASALRVR